MSNAGPGPGDVFDVRKIRRLVELMNDHDLAEIDLRQADQRIRLRRGGEMQPATVIPAVSVPPAGVTAPDSGRAAHPASSAPGTASDASVTIIKCPMVGTLYTAPSPNAEPFVKVGDYVSPNSTVCIVEAMKVFNEIPAECSGRIVAVLVENGEPVEYGQPLFKVDSSV
jgi:acetyl-CoA carboxylase biotin carboxyl carrier protein